MTAKTCLRLITVLLGLWLGAAGPAQALCLSPVCSCTLATTPVTFGSYNPLAFGNTDSTGSLRVQCGGVVGLLIPFDLALTAGGGGSFGGRRMRKGSDALSYNLYTDSSYATIWGDGTGGTQLVSSGVTLDLLGLSPPQVFSVYGRIPGRQLTAVPGSYSDSISVTLTYY